jgi:hypothetical protein
MTYRIWKDDNITKNDTGDVVKGGHKGFIWPLPRLKTKMDFWSQDFGWNTTIRYFEILIEVRMWSLHSYCELNVPW